MTDLSQIKSLIDALEKDTSLQDPKNFDDRADALELIEFYITGTLKTRAEVLKASLEEIDKKLFEELRAGVMSGQYKGKAFENLIGEYFDLADIDTSKEGYDNLDVFINRLLSTGKMPEPTQELSPEMVFYQKTSARVVFEMAKKTGFTKNDVFFDIGSGLGQVGIMINLIAGIPVYGIEYEPAFCKFGSACAAGLDLGGVNFINSDAREADYSSGTVFFMYTPFRGEMLRQVLSKLKEQAVQRRIKVITYGPCGDEVAKESWLKATADVSAKDHLRIFKSI